MKLNLPNKITLIRLLLTPIVIFFFLATFIPYNKFIAVIIFIIAISTDYIDGRIARKRNMVTNLGSYLDPVADKLLFFSCIILLVVSQVFYNDRSDVFTIVGQLFAIILLGSEIATSALRQISAVNKTEIIENNCKKIIAPMQDITVVVLIVLSQMIDLRWVGYVYGGVNPYAGLAHIVQLSSYALALTLTCVTLVSMVSFIVINKSVLSQQKQPKQK